MMQGPGVSPEPIGIKIYVNFDQVMQQGVAIPGAVCLQGHLSGSHLEGQTESLVCQNLGTKEPRNCGLITLRGKQIVKLGNITEICSHKS
jgi:hypothetical protein